MESVRSAQRLTDDYNQGIADRLKPKLNELKREGDSKISLASEKRKLFFIEININICEYYQVTNTKICVYVCVFQ